MSDIRRFSNRSSIANEARRWLVRLDSDTPLDKQEVEALREWLGRSPAHRRELKRISGFWDNANILTELAVPLHRPQTRPSPEPAHSGYALFGRYAAGAVTIGFVLAATVVLMSWLLPQPEETAGKGLYATGIGERRTVTLPDGSSSQLNTNSIIQVSYTAELRKIRLLRGEAHFEVAPDPRKPFEVYAEGSMVRAVGTAFSVRLLSDDVKVTVREGEVELVTVKRRTSADETSGSVRVETLGLLRRGQSAVFGKTVATIVDLDVEKLTDELSWRDGFLSFSGEPLSRVVAEINRYTSKTIEIAEPDLESVPVGGRFRIDDLDEIFEVLQTSFGIRVSRVGDQHILLRSTEAP